MPVAAGRLRRDQLAAMASDLGIGSTVTSVRRLGGGISSTAHVLRFANGRTIVLKRYTVGSDTAAQEWARLGFAHGAGLLVPRPLGVDDGTWFGTPAVAMERLPGRADLFARSLDAYVTQVAATIADVHAVRGSALPSELKGPRPTRPFALPQPVPLGLLSARQADRVAEALEASLPLVPRRRNVLNHGDFHPGNVLWRRGRLTGLVDWSYAKAGGRWPEIAHFRVELAMLADARPADALVARYEHVTNVIAPALELAVWDLHTVFDAHRWARWWLPGYHEHGRRDLTLGVLTRRLRAFARDALRRLDAAR